MTDLIRGLRANKKDEQHYIRAAIVECKREARSQDVDVKAGAILKLTYLAMFGQDMSWASFHTIEVMASPKYINKRIGYMAASQGFRQDTDVLMLSTNLMKKDISSANAAEVSLALGGLGDIVTPDLARDLNHDLIGKLTHSKATVRKKAVLTMYKIFLQYPEALRSTYPKLRDRLEDEDQAVVSATINVIVELSRKNPKNFLPLAPLLFELLTTSSNNWMLIKIIKLFAGLTPLEPRLIKKLVPPLTDLIHSTTAMSLLYECINTVISGEMLNHPNSESLAKLCIAKLRTFFEQGDQNLKYVGLLAFSKLMQSHPDLVAIHQDVIMEAIDDTDISIRMRALELTSFMPTKRTLPDIVRRLMLQLVPNSSTPIPTGFRRDLVLRLLQMCNNNLYKHIENFDWYVAVLIDLVSLAKVDVANELRSEIMNVCVRVKSVREFAVPALSRLVYDHDIMLDSNNLERNAAVLGAAVWVVGEYSNHVENIKQVMNNILASPMEKLSPVTQCSYLQALPKLYTRWIGELSGHFDHEIRTEIQMQTSKIAKFLDKFAISSDIEVQQRAVELSQLVAIAEQCLDVDADNEDEIIPQFFSDILPNLYFSGGDLNPIARTAQQHIMLPTGLDLDAWIVEPTPPPTPVATFATNPINDEYPEEYDEKALEEQRRERRERNLDDPFYIKDLPVSKTDGASEVDQLDTPELLLPDEPLLIKRKKRKPRTNVPVEILLDEVPEGFVPMMDERPTEVATMKAKDESGVNVLRVDGSKLTHFNLDGEDEVDEVSNYLPYETYQVTKEEVKKKQSKTKKSRSKEVVVDNVDDDVVEVSKKKVSVYTSMYNGILIHSRRRRRSRSRNWMRHEMSMMHKSTRHTERWHIHILHVQ